jgi:hypothetical protein
MATLKLVLTLPNYDKATLIRDYQLKSRHQTLNVLSNLMAKANCGLAHGSGNTLVVTVPDSQTQASGTVTCASVSAADTVTVGNIVFTATAGTPTGNQFKCGVTNTADALSLVTAINANTSLSPYVTALSALGVVTITSTALGDLGNLLQLSSSNNTRLAVVSFASGVADSGVKTFSM